ncbi:hypothetical protein PUN28_019508 [Cardiocondyla obscurior]|uniref:Uncharacterized protein n=1 Tax=Cardiocondyla obscurior TaxID=286306 RepID=A0AAW2EEM5_9HYME
MLYIIIYKFLTHLRYLASLRIITIKLANSLSFITGVPLATRLHFNCGTCEIFCVLRYLSHTILLGLSDLSDLHVDLRYYNTILFPFFVRHSDPLCL